MAVSYPADGNAVFCQLEDDSVWFRHRNRCITAVVGQFPPAGPILDIGGGNGVVARALIDAGHPTSLLEPGAVGAANARQRRNIPDVINTTLEDAGLPQASVAAAGLFDVVEHIQDDRGFVAELRDLLKPGGLVYVTVPAHQWLWSAADVDAGHYRRYSTGGLRALFESAGFEVQYATYFFEMLIVPLFLMRTLPSAIGVSKRLAASDYVEHAAGGRRLSAWLQALMAHEVRAIERQRTLMTGTSCLLVARKPA